MNVAIWLATAFVVFSVAIHFASVAITACQVVKARRMARPDSEPPVTILRPVCGIDCDAEATLRSTFELDWPDYEAIFCSANEGRSGRPAGRTVYRRVSADTGSARIERRLGAWRSSKLSRSSARPRAIQPLDVRGVLSASIDRRRRTRINHS